MLYVYIFLLLVVFNAIEKYSVWKVESFRTKHPLNWKNIIFYDKSWNTYKFCCEGSNSTVTYGTHYYRMEFHGIEQYPAYEIQIRYKSGIIVYINGMELFRDNMPEGSINATTQATGDYQAYSYHGFIRSGSEINSTSLLAIETHWINNSIAHPYDIDAWIAQYLAGSSSDCYVYPYDVLYESVYPNGISSHDIALIYDMNIDTQWISKSQALSFRVTPKGPSPIINSFELYARVDARFLPMSSTVSMEKNGQIFTMANIELMSYMNNNYSRYRVYPRGLLYDHFLFSFRHLSEFIELSEFRLDICSFTSPKALSYVKSLFNVIENVTFLNLFPQPSYVSTCYVKPMLPSSLILKSDCSIVGRVNISGIFVFTVGVIGESLKPTVLTVISSRCEHHIIKITRQYGLESFRSEVFRLVDNVTDSVVYEEKPSTVQRRGDIRQFYLCTASNYIRLSMNSIQFVYWEKGSSLTITWISPLFRDETNMEIFRGRYDTRIGEHSVVVLNLVFPINFDAVWSYWMESIPPNWMNNDISRWKTGISPDWPDTLYRYQLFKKIFNVYNTSTLSTVELRLSYSGGIIIYINGYFIYRLDAPEILTESSVSSSTLSHPIWTTVSFSARPRLTANGTVSNYINTGSNVISIAVLHGQNTSKVTYFACAMRLVDGFFVIENHLMTASLQHFDQTVFLMLNDANTPIESKQCLGREIILSSTMKGSVFINMLEIVSSYYTIEEIPTFIMSVFVDSRWIPVETTSETHTERCATLHRYWLLINYPINKLKISFSDDVTNLLCRIKIGAIRVACYSLSVDNEVLSYHIDSIVYNRQLPCFMPTSIFFTLFIPRGLPEGIRMDMTNGCLYGKPTVRGLFHLIVNATRIDGMTVEEEFDLVVAECKPFFTVLNVFIHTGEDPTMYAWRLISSVSPDVIIPSRSPVTNEHLFVDNPTALYPFHDHIFVYCVPLTIFRIEFTESSVAWDKPSGYEISTDNGAFHLISGAFDAEQKKQGLFSSHMLFERGISYWNYWPKTHQPPSDWTQLTASTHDWLWGSLSDVMTDGRSTTYVRCIVRVATAMNFSLLKVQIHYIGGVAAYANGRRVARFNLAETYDYMTPPIIQFTEERISRFHVSLTLDNFVVGSNVIAFEIHHNSHTPSFINFDASGRISINPCSYSSDSVINIESNASIMPDYPIANALTDSFMAFTYILTSLHSSISWEIDNLEPTRVNSFSIAGGRIDGFGYKLFGSHDKNNWTELIHNQDIHVEENVPHVYPISLGMMGFRYFRFIVHTSSVEQYVARINCMAFSLIGSDGVSCPALEGFPAVFNGQLSPGVCPSNLIGTAFRICQNGMLSAIILNNCHEMSPSYLEYDIIPLLFVGVFMQPVTPQFVGIARSFECYPSLPRGLVIDQDTGTISGLMEESIMNYVVLIRVVNEAGATSTSVVISCVYGMCRKDGYWKDQVLKGDSTQIIFCSDLGDYIGIQKRSCGIENNEIVWSDVSGYCASKYAVIMVIVALCIALSFIFLQLTKVPIILKRKSPTKSDKNLLKMEFREVEIV